MTIYLLHPNANIYLMLSKLNLLIYMANVHQDLTVPKTILDQAIDKT